MKQFLIITIFIMANIINETALAEKLDIDKMFSRAMINTGNTSRLKRVFEKAGRGKKITIGVIGGSITQGAGASKHENKWANLITKWWKKTFPKAEIKLVNAGIGATDSMYGALRAQDDLLKYKPDFVVIEYAVNDPKKEIYAKTIEGLLRQILNSPGKPAAMMLFTMNKNGENSQVWHSQVGKHYDIPMISYRNAAWQEIADGNIPWQDVCCLDEVHPNDLGHKLCAAFITMFLDGVLNADTKGEIATPLFTDTFEFAKRFKGSNLVPEYKKGWRKNKHGWEAEKPGSEIVFKIPGTFIALLYYTIKGDMGIVEITVDNKIPLKLDGCFTCPGDWNGEHTPSQIIAEDLKPGMHKVRIKLLEEKAPKSKSHRFEIREIMAFGK